MHRDLIMPKFFWDRSQLFFAFLAVLLGGLFFSLSTHCYYSDSEIWLLTLSQRALNPGDLISIYFKWLFHSVTKVASFAASTNLELYTATRWLYALIAIFALVFNALAFAKIFANKNLFLPLFIITLTSSLFFNQGFRIRADVLALLFHSLFIWTVVTSQRFDFFKMTLLILLNLALLLTTPKSLIFVVLHTFLGAFYLFLSHNKISQVKGRAILLSVFIPGTLGLLFLSLLSVLNPSHLLLLSLKSAVDFYFKSFDPGLGGAHFFRAYDFMYLVRFFSNSLVHTFLFLCWVFLFFKAIVLNSERTEDHLIFDLSTALLIIFIFLYNQKLPFFLGPFLTPVIAHQFCVFWNCLQKSKWKSITVLCLLLASSALAIRQYITNQQLNNNWAQRKVIAEIEEYKTKHPAVSFYDVVGLLPLNNSYYFFMGPGEVSRRQPILSALKSNPPDIYLYTLKNVFFEPDLKAFLEAEYWQSQPGVWVKAKNIKLDKTSYFTNNILRINNQSYWLTRGESQSTIFSRTTGKEITSLCFFLNEQKQVSHNDIFWIAIPMDSINVSIVSLPPLHLSTNPYTLFRFDTAF